MIRLEGVAKSYGGAAVLLPLTLEVSTQTTLAVIGRSGSGKSTLLRLVVGLVPPDQGSVLVAGGFMTSETARMLRHRIGYVIQEGGLFPHLTARENATLVARHLGWSKARVEARVRELAELTHLPAELLDRYPMQMSGGERQRVALMRALFLDPEVLLLDEPLGALDPLTRTKLQGELRSIFQTLRKTVLFVTHDLQEAERVADEIAIISEGRIVQRGPIERLCEAPAEPFVAELLATRGRP